MKLKTILIGIFMSIIIVLNCYAQKDDFPVLKGPYLGQQPPGNIPELFAPGIVSTGANEVNICFSVDGNEVFYNVTGPTFQPKIILTSHTLNSVWIIPRELPFFDIERSYSYPFLTYDGKKLFFNSSRSQEIMFVERDNGEWGNPKGIDFGVEYDGNSGFPSVALNGNMYFFAVFNGEKPAIYFSKYENGIYTSPEKLGETVNGGVNAINFHPYIAPDESYLLFDSRREDENFGLNDIYICFRDNEGRWSKAKNLGKIINSPNYELRPYVTYDGKYLFFISDKRNKTELPINQLTSNEVGGFINQPGNGLQDIYWVSAEIIKKLKPKELK